MKKDALEIKRRIRILEAELSNYGLQWMAD
jgi:hypothetical protein